ncbi:calcineurin subunit B, putative [Entamoeba invadens IP1]|uniref:Calcineurin subunit B, putative n=1 Tax=Entamoeba invadens IP1 TaxID=370355 RepID=A0A0A1UHC2_ENTIV|nr:calcineurin subunit B, putative [Entamoeba invadens IP1]ELP95067.1 calcineurin subunit B, putative [Entamoeba invadens IP1]|eukprot:XP_004261838.1 calcineurin subunit B, putative [Entamoeba invadens IP1]
MGNQLSGLKQEDVEQMMQTTNFSESELRRLFRRFKKLDTKSKEASTDEYDDLAELTSNPVLKRLLQIFNKYDNEELQFSQFVATLSTLSDKGSQEAKLRFAFQVYDVDSDGFISNGELFQVLKMIIGGSFTDEQLQQVVDKTIIEADKDRDGKISYDEFCGIILKNSENIGEKLTINWQ